MDNNSHLRRSLKIVHVVGARPNFVKIASVLVACRKTSEIKSILVHTGQHYSDNMSDNFFEDLEIPLPDVNLEVGSGSHAEQTSEIMKRFEPVVLEHKPDAVLVVGDVNSTVACALVATKLGIKIIHVEAGLRSFDRTMPEEINRILTDAISDILFVTEPSGVVNLKNEGIDGHKIHLVGNVMMDTLEMYKGKIDKSDILVKLNLLPKEFCIATLHRPDNVDKHQTFHKILNALVEIQKQIKIVFPVHPRTLKQLESMGLIKWFVDFPNIILTEPLGYLDFVKLMSESRIIITDSGGIQEETTALGVPCLTVRENTERPITVTKGTNMLVGNETNDIISGFQKNLYYKRKYDRPHLWDGKASERIVQVLLNIL